MQINVPKPHVQPSVEPSELALLEFASMSASKRIIINYERRIDELSRYVAELSGKNDCLHKELHDAVIQNATIPQLKRGKTELYISSFIATVLMAIGGGLISSFPIIDHKVPYQFVIGWMLLAAAIFLGAVIRPIVWVVYYKFVCKQSQAIPAISTTD